MPRRRQIWFWSACMCVAVLLAPAPGGAVKRRAFATQAQGTGDLSSWPNGTGANALARGDSICRAAAANAFPQPLPNAGSYRAWLSTSTTDAFCHVQGLTGKKANNCGAIGRPIGGPWFLSNGAVNFVGTLAELANGGEIYRPISRDENFDPLPTAGDERVYWTGTDSAGVWTGVDCAGWTDDSPGEFQGTVGDGYRTAGMWSKADQFACAGEHRLLCLEPGDGDVSTLGWSPASLVFLSSVAGKGNLAAWPQAGGATGAAAGDAICQNLAAASSLPAPESFVAWLSTTSPLVNAADRVGDPGRWKRVDAYTVANDHADLVDSTLANTIHQFETGDYLEADCSGFSLCNAWTGTDADGTAAAANCANWTDDSGASGAKGSVANGPLPTTWTQFGTTSCNVSYRLYCFSTVVTIFWDGFESGNMSRWSAALP